VLCGDAAHSNCLFFGFTRSGLKHTLYRTRVEHANHYSSQVEKLQIKRQMGPCYSIFSFVCFVDRCFFHLSFFCDCVVCPSIYGLLLLFAILKHFLIEHIVNGSICLHQFAIIFIFVCYTISLLHCRHNVIIHWISLQYYSTNGHWNDISSCVLWSVEMKGNISNYALYFVC